MNAETSEELTAGQLLRSALRRIYRRYRVKHVWFQNSLYSLIADDSDWHRTRRGYMRYRTGKIIRLGPREKPAYWLLARGEACGAYPADPYDSDILAVRLDELPAAFGQELAAEMAAQIQQYSYFQSSLIVAQSDGNLSCPTGNIMGARLSIACEGPAAGWVAQRMETDPGLIQAATLMPVVIRKMRYRPEAAADLARLIVQSLKMC